MNTVVQSLFVSKQFNDAVLQALNREREKTLQNPVIGAYCHLSKSLVGDKSPAVHRFVESVRGSSARWVGMCDSFEFLEYVLEHLEALSGVNISKVV